MSRSYHTEGCCSAHLLARSVCIIIFFIIIIIIFLFANTKFQECYWAGN